MIKPTWIFTAILLFFALTACQTAGSEAAPIPTATRNLGELTPYTSKTPVQATQVPEARATLTPAPTPTPQIHVVALDETLISIAYKYGITLEALQNANPEVNPWAIYVGDEIIIPYVEAGEEADPNAAPAPDPEPVELSEAVCTPEASGGLWCLWTATNPEDGGTENILTEILLNDGSKTLSKTVTAPVNISKAGERVPMGAFFTAQELAGMADPITVQVSLLQALPLSNTPGRYVPIILQDGLITIKNDRQSAVITGNLVVSADASSVWVVAAAYADSGTLVGFLRWSQETALSAGTSLPLEMQVFALGDGKIASVELLLEAHP
ncbi:MAG: LysM domain-containing protein [Anaerolineae bacterium]|jgi:LysM repeat protein|nr:LysM domain-containing protein [Anaerolineae bacterium]